jgi:general secretion pathway protein C
VEPVEDQEGNGEENPPGDAFPAERVGNTYQVTVPNAEVDKAFENFSEIVAQAAAVPIIEDGEAKGFQLRKIRPGSIFERLGLKNFDLIRGVNGQSITTADQALRVFTLFRNEREIVLDVKRRDEDLQFNYTIE